LKKVGNLFKAKNRSGAKLMFKITSIQNLASYILYILIVEPNKKCSKTRSPSFVSIAKIANTKGTTKWFKSYFPYSLPKKNEINTRMNEESPNGEVDIKSKKSPEPKLTNIEILEPL